MMKRFSILAISLGTACGLFICGAAPGYAGTESVTMTFTGVGPGNNSGGVYTYPYNFTVTPTGGGASYNTSLMCISFNNEIYIQNPNEQWTANVVDASTLGTLGEEYGYLYAQASGTSNTTLSGAANWADWALGQDPSNPDAFLKSHLSGAELTDAEAFVTDAQNLTSIQLAGYADYLLYEPTSDGYSGNTNDGWPQAFVGGPAGQNGVPPPATTPEPGSLMLLGTGLLGLATLLYYRRQNATGSI